MAADGGDMTFALPDLSGLSEAERLQVMAVMQRAKVGVSSIFALAYWTVFTLNKANFRVKIEACHSKFCEHFFRQLTLVYSSLF